MAVGDRIAVIGAGVAGLCVAERLTTRGASVVVFDKGRGPGGRSASRHRAERAGHDHGAQYFTAREPGLIATVSRWTAEGQVARWTADIGVLEADGRWRHTSSRTRWVGTPSMRAPAEAMASTLDVRQEVEVASLRLDPSGVELATEAESLGRFDRVILTAPAPQAWPLVAEVDPGLARIAESVRFLPTWAVLLHLERPLPTELGAAFVNRGPIAWWAREASKPGRSGEERVTVHLGEVASTDWREASATTVIERTLPALAELFGALGPVNSASAHRWRFARPAEALGVGALVGGRGRVILAGDWTGGAGRFESAFAAGEAAAEAVLR